MAPAEEAITWRLEEVTPAIMARTGFNSLEELREHARSSGLSTSGVERFEQDLLVAARAASRKKCCVCREVVEETEWCACWRRW